MFNKFTTAGLSFPAQGSAGFNGTSDYIQTDNPFSHTNHTIAAWVYANDDANNKIIFDNRDAGSDGLVFFSTGSEIIQHTFNNSTLASTSSYTDEWIYAVGSYDGTTQKLYINGSQVASATTSQTINTTTNAIIGARSFSTKASFFNGNLANVAIWNRALTSDEINSVMWKTYEQVSTTESNGLQAWYKLSADEVLSGTSTATLTTYANANSLTFEAPACVQTALNGLPDITDARLYSANYDIRVKADGGNVESLNCVETELNAIL